MYRHRWTVLKQYVLLNIMFAWCRNTPLYLESAIHVHVLYDFWVTVKATPHQCVIRTGLP